MGRDGGEQAPVGKVECGLRVVQGEQSGLGAKWTHGVAGLVPGAILLTPYIGGVRLLRKGLVRIPVQRVDRSERVGTGLREAWSVRPGLRVVRVETGSATLEWALSPRRADWAAEAVVLA